METRLIAIASNNVIVKEIRPKVMHEIGNFHLHRFLRFWRNMTLVRLYLRSIKIYFNVPKKLPLILSHAFDLSVFINFYHVWFVESLQLLIK